MQDQRQAEGAAREAIVKADLLRRGFEIFSAEYGTTSFDMAAYKHGLFLRVEVKGDTRRVPRNSPVGGILKRSLDCRKFDVLAAVDNQAVRYMRSLLHGFNAASEELVGAETPSKATTRKNQNRAKKLLENQ